MKSYKLYTATGIFITIVSLTYVLSKDAYGYIGESTELIIASTCKTKLEQFVQSIEPAFSMNQSKDWALKCVKILRVKEEEADNLNRFMCGGNYQITQSASDSYDAAKTKQSWNVVSINDSADTITTEESFLPTILNATQRAKLEVLLNDRCLADEKQTQIAYSNLFMFSIWKKPILHNPMYTVTIPKETTKAIDVAKAKKDNKVLYLIAPEPVVVKEIEK